MKRRRVELERNLEADPLFTSAALCWRQLLGADSVDAATRLPEFLLSPSISVTEDGSCAGPTLCAAAVRDSFTCHSCAALHVCSACIDMCHNGHVVERSREDAPTRWEGCECGSGARCLLVPTGRASVLLKGCDRGLLSSLVQCVFVLGMPNVIGASRDYYERLFGEASNADGFIQLHRLLRALQQCDELTGALPPLPNLANTAGLLSLSPFFRVFKLGSRSRVGFAPRHPRADIVISAAARHVHGALQQIGTLPPALVLQTRFIGTLALDRVIEPVALLWASGLIARPATLSLAMAAGLLARFCTTACAPVSGNRQADASARNHSDVQWCVNLAERGPTLPPLACQCRVMPTPASVNSRLAVRAEQSPLRLPLHEPVSTGNAAVIASLPVGATDGLLDVKCLPTGTGRAANGTHWQAEVYRGPTTQSRPVGIGSLGEPPAARAGRDVTMPLALPVAANAVPSVGPASPSLAPGPPAEAVPLALALPVALALAVPGP